MSTASLTSPVSTPVPSAAPAYRVESVDALRGLVITLMVFVNDVAGIPRAPGWLKHVGAKADAMTLPDIVFPSFLFIAGVSIPLAFERAEAKGTNRRELFAKIVGRTFALLVMGVLMVNCESYDPWPHNGWGIAAFVAMFLAFAVVPGDVGPARNRWRIARLLGAVSIFGLALTYTNQQGRHLLFGPLFDTADSQWLRHSWWGILGLIGWAYLVAATLYLLVGRRREWLLGATGLLMLVYLSGRAESAARLASRPWLDWAHGPISTLQCALGWLNAQVNIGEDLGSLAGVTMAGCCLGAILLPHSDLATPRQRLRWVGLFTAGLFVAAVLLDPLYGLNKIRATPSWCLLCAAIAAGGWMSIYWLMDLRGYKSWSRLVRPAGANPLIPFLLHPLLYLTAGATGLNIEFYKNQDLPVALSVSGSLVMALLVVQLTGLIVRLGYRMKA